uniref:DDE Tnp4 domain-containing protein n=1 Tax=Sinocyclocheilus rhinocerous TaxID=307959 RepID=A0A673L1Z4_9TELE
RGHGHRCNRMMCERKAIAYPNHVFLLLSLGKPSDDPLSPDYIPSKLPYRPDPSRKMDRYQRSLRRASEVYEMNTTEEVEDMDTDVAEVKSYSDMCVGTDLTMRDIEDMEKLNTSYKDQVRSLESKVQTLTCERKQLKSDVDLKDDQIIHFYTGLRSSKVFFALLTYLTTAWSPRTLSPPTALQFYLVLMKLRLGLTHKDLAFRFHCSCATISTIFHDWLNIMAQRFTSLIHWPSREEIKKNLPTLFRSPPFNAVRCIIDCSEIFIDRPTSLSARAMTYSNYKSHNTIKFLVGISPTGSITFLSKSWGGRASDKTITKLSGLIDLLEEGDIVMADRATHTIITLGKTQLSGQEVYMSRHMSRMRIHVERAIGRIKNYCILRQTLPINLVKRRPKDTVATVDKMLLVCSALSNLDKSLIQ